MANYRIRLFNKIAESGLENFGPDYLCSEDTTDYHGILVRSYDLNNIAFSDQLLAIARAGAGVNNIPVAQCSEAGIVVFNTPGANANAVKELAIAAMIIGSRNILPAVKWLETLPNQDLENKVEAYKSHFVGKELYGKKLGVIGLGHVGVLVANAGLDLGMEVYGYDPYLSIKAAWNLSRSVHNSNSIREIFSKCDFISLHLPYSENTKNFVNRAVFEELKPQAILLNLARGGLVDTQALLAALASKRLALYITDFIDADLQGHPAVLAFPHLGASTLESEDNCAIMATLQMKDFLENGNIQNSVNLPNVSMEKTGQVRISCLHRNIPKMIAQITEVISHLNIENLTNKSKDEYAYTLVDVDAPLTGDDVEKLKAIKGMLKVRVVY